MKHINKKRAILVGPPHLWQEKRDCQIKFLLQYGLKPDQYLLDLGCGVLRGGIPIINYLNEGHYYGVEKDPGRLEEGIKELKEFNLSNKNPHLSTTYTDVDIKFDYIWAFQVFIHLSDKILKEVLLNIKHLLKDKGVCYATVALNKNRVHSSWREYPYVERPLSFYEKVASKANLSIDLVNYVSKGSWRDMLEIRKAH